MLKSDVVPSSFAFKQDVMDDSRAKRAELKLALTADSGIGCRQTYGIWQSNQTIFKKVWHKLSLYQLSLTRFITNNKLVNVGHKFRPPFSDAFEDSILSSWWQEVK